jgi:hypothetical protein
MTASLTDIIIVIVVVIVVVVVVVVIIIIIIIIIIILCVCVCVCVCERVGCRMQTLICVLICRIRLDVTQVSQQISFPACLPCCVYTAAQKLRAVRFPVPHHPISEGGLNFVLRTDTQMGF